MTADIDELLDPAAVRKAKALRIRAAQDITLPKLSYWTTNPDDALRRHQRIGVAWLYMVGDGILADGVGLGKCQPLDATILTPYGWRKMGELQLGDLVTTPGGPAAAITGVFPQGHKQVYRVELTDGSLAESSGEHLWRVRRNREAWQVLTLDDIVSRGLVNPNGGKRWEVSRLDIDDPVASKDCPLDPYTLGAFIADMGMSDHIPIYSCDEGDGPMLARIAETLPPEVALKRKKGSRPWDYAVTKVVRGKAENPVTRALRDLGLWGKLSAEKFVPEHLLRAHRDVRLELLRGLMDADGWIAKPGSGGYCSMSKQLAEDVAYLARSLGGYASVRSALANYTYNGERRCAGTKYTVCLNLPNDNPFWQPRKANQWRPGRKQRRIKSVTATRVVATQCIAIDHPHHLYVTGDLIATHNTPEIIGTIALAKQKGQMTNRAIVICRPTALPQWRDDGFDKFAPRLNVITVMGNRASRINQYCTNFDVCLIGHQMLLHDLDLLLAQGPWSFVIADDVDPIRNDNATSYAFKALAKTAERTIIASATPVQTQLLELHRLLCALGADGTFGSELQFTQRHIREETRTTYDYEKQRKVRRKVRVGYKNMAELREAIKPYYLRRTHKDLDDQDLPDLIPDNVWLDMYPRQWEEYRKLRMTVAQALREGGSATTRAAAMAKTHMASAITAGLATIDLPDIYGESSVKLDWIQDKLPTDLEDQKIVMFCSRKNTIRAVQARLTAARIGHVTIWGEEPDMEKRRKSQKKFWDDPSTQVCLGTSAMEQSLNLQCASVLINVDTLMNPRRMEQIAGRLRRLGSPHKTVWVYNLLCAGTHEEKQIPILKQRQALGDFLFEEQSELYDALSPEELLELIRE